MAASLLQFEINIIVCTYGVWIYRECMRFKISALWFVINHCWYSEGTGPG